MIDFRIRGLVLAASLVLLAGCTKEIPNLALSGPFGEETDLSGITGDADHAVLAFFIGGRCAMSPMAARLVKEFHETEPDFTAFAGILIDGSGDQAQAFRETHELPFPVYGLNRRHDPLAWNDLVRNMGSSKRQLLGGTIAVVDRDRKVRYSADGEKIRDAPDRMQRLLGW